MVDNLHNPSYTKNVDIVRNIPTLTIRSVR